MPKYPIKLLETVWQDLDRIADRYLELSGVSSAQKITNQLLDKLEILADFPHAGPVHPDLELAALDFRKLPLTKYYVAIYKFVGEEVCVYRVVDGRTDYPKLLK